MAVCRVVVDLLTSPSRLCTQRRSQNPQAGL
nr:MAG TPA: hypothetical protein [Caudoviricetes sp.]